VSSLDERVARLRAEKSRLLARANQAERKRDARRKILIGAAVLAAVQHEGVPALNSSTELLRWIDSRLTRPHDRAVFDFQTP
jgi:large subunit ribosomal protein L7/L12